ncbi:hypothetical protein PMSD_25155 [Paenibacillus macquariensis subsp. defensor]|nr:hypothetical protein PMSD_25155 [Paenibacillus macquariensis subsp. defensor]
MSTVKANGILPDEDPLSAINEDTDVYFPKHKTIQQFLEEQVKRNPDAVAVSFQDDSYTYGQINEQANILASYLRNIKRVETGEVLGIIAVRSIEMIVGIYAIVKAGANYLPISSDLPSQRINFLIHDSGIRYILNDHKQLVPEGLAETIDMTEAMQHKEFTENLSKTCVSTDPIYVIYTSGSTGKPKGVIVEHQSVVNRLHWMQKQYPLTPNDVILQKTPAVFDVSVWELFWWSFSGAAMHLLNPEMERFPQAIIEAIESKRVTVVHFVPSMLVQFLKYIEGTSEVNRLSSLRYIFTSGEVLSPVCVELFNRILPANIGARLINLYGPTEATVDVTYYECPTEGRINKIPIGKPIDNTKIYIMKNGEPQSVGVEGEICISGVGLARGYLNRPELTMDKFVSYPTNTQGKLYRTGDLGTWLSDGNIAFHGRQDYQVKIRGLRIELEEIESVIMELDYIEQCAVITIEKDSDVLITAFVVPKGDVDIVTLKQHLKDNLPPYMVPNTIRVRQDLPVLASGKINRNELRDIC